MELIADARKAMQDAPKGTFNCHVLFWTCVVALAGVSKGFMRVGGNITSLVSQSHFKARFGLDTQSPTQYSNTKGWIVSIATACAVFGCLWVITTLKQSTVDSSDLYYVTGILGQGLCHGSLSGLWASRFIAGLGVGPLSIVPPVYITEISPEVIRLEELDGLFQRPWYTVHQVASKSVQGAESETMEAKAEWAGRAQHVEEGRAN
ncbi:hypothetical protein BP00DRAFT_446297 [Aspergillus indologenus CBS 114.80]|uniref:General substrate transporter n=1 Tax=Aspergillus indologenus CBS 114.80 TaxID=1450541 RepID=A0A2V5IBU4_9EURO|nr:hypothetical protein BP00DRAFT_446297 [Aspergillus indologenus CBS 114.80]